MRTTLTLDPDVAVLLTRLMKGRNLTLKVVINQALRQGLQQLASPPRKRRRISLRPLNLGRCLLPNLDNVEEVLDWAEGADRR